MSREQSGTSQQEVLSETGADVQREDVKDSTPVFPKEVQAPQGAHNGLLIMTDDVGFVASGTLDKFVLHLGATNTAAADQRELQSGATRVAAARE
jgi:hypothetical protein